MHFKYSIMATIVNFVFLAVLKFNAGEINKPLKVYTLLNGLDEYRAIACVRVSEGDECK